MEQPKGIRMPDGSIVYEEDMVSPTTEERIQAGAVKKQLDSKAKVRSTERNIRRTIIIGIIGTTLLFVLTAWYMVWSFDHRYVKRGDFESLQQKISQLERR